MGKDNSTQNSGSPPLRFIQPELREDSESGESKAGVAGAHGSAPWKELTYKRIKKLKKNKAGCTEERGLREKRAGPDGF